MSKIIVNVELSHLDFIICKKNKIIFTNIDNLVEIEKINKLIDTFKPTKHARKNPKSNEESSTKVYNKNIDYKPSSNEASNNNKNVSEDSHKRKSYRQKVQDLNEKKDILLNEDAKNIDVIKEQGEQEKRQGWWNQ